MRTAEEMSIFRETVTRVFSFLQIAWVFSSLFFGWKLLILTVICWFAGSGLRGSLYGIAGQKVFGLVAAIIFVSGSLLASKYVSTEIIFQGVILSANQWLLLSFGIGFCLTTKHLAIAE
tara:strand:+ start:17 stop:373 length:357 start_codon:yes stop_codon:yes gene_type:complete